MRKRSSTYLIISCFFLTGCWMLQPVGGGGNIQRRVEFIEKKLKIEPPPAITRGEAIGDAAKVASGFVPDPFGKIMFWGGALLAAFFRRKQENG